MPEYDDTNTGFMMRNDKRETDKHPEFTGNINIEGEEYWLSAWVNESKSGKKYFRLSFNPKNPRQQEAESSQGSADFDDQIPF